MPVPLSFLLGFASLLATQAIWVQPALGQTNFHQAIFTKQFIKLSGGVVIDSFNSQDPTKSTNGQYDPSKRQDGGNIGSTADTVTELTETGSVRVYGRAATGPLGQITTTGVASIGSLAWVDGGNRGIQPGWSSNTLTGSVPDVQLPSLTFVPLPRNGGTVGGEHYTYVLTNGNYVSAEDLSLAGSQSMAIVGNVVLHLQKKLSTSGSAQIYITPGSKLTIYLAGDAQLSGGGIVNGTGNAKNCGYYGLPSCTSFDYSGSSGFFGTIYAPQANVKLSGGGSTGLNFIGAVVANSADLNGKYEFHYDENLCGNPPVANNDGYTTPEDIMLAVPAPGVLSNDGDVDGDALSATLVSGPAHGSVTLNADGSFNYRPANSYRGSDSFTYYAGDGQTNSNIATVHFMVSPVNHQPVAVNDFYTTPENMVLTISTAGVLANDTDPDGDALIALLASNPLHGTLSFSENGNFIYVPNANFSGPDNFTYLAFDADTNAVLIATVAITVTPVNQQPVAVNDFYTTPENKVLNISAPGVLGNDSDPDGDVLIARLASNPLHGTLTFSTDGTFTYIPDVNFSGPDNFTYLAFDANTNAVLIATVAITVTPVNQQPVAVNDFYTTPAGTTLSISAPGVLGNDSDPDGDALIARLASNPLHGTLTFSTDGTFTYVPDANFSGPDNFTYLAFDANTNAILIATVSITVVGSQQITGTQQHINQGQFTNNTFVVEFDSLANRLYVVQYSPDLQNWKSAEPAVPGTGGVVQWIDDGPPKTDSAPMTQTMRFYRLMLLPE